MNHQPNKQLVQDLWQELEKADTATAFSVFSKHMHNDVIWRGYEPIGTLHGIESIVDQFWAPLLHSFPDPTRDTFLFLAGTSNGRIDGNIELDGKHWVTGSGQFHATFTHDYLGIAASGKSVSVRWGEFCRIDNGQIVEVFFLIDLVDLMEQVGINVLPPSRGKSGIYVPPAAGDGVLLDAADEKISLYSRQHLREFIFDGLNAFDQDNLASMGMADYFHPNLKWYGPGGIGACLSFKEFEELHQQPWLVAFPDRSVQNLDALFAEGAYSAAPGWAGVKGNHTGPYLNHPATGNPVDFNGLDWWKRDGEVYTENWVLVDMIYLFKQLGVDLMQRAKSK